jgi:hypothetical protein
MQLWFTCERRSLDCRCSYTSTVFHGTWPATLSPTSTKTCIRVKLPSQLLRCYPIAWYALLSATVLHGPFVMQSTGKNKVVLQRVEVAMHISLPLVKANRLFSRCSSGFTASLSVLLREISMASDDILFRANGICNELYFISSSSVNLINAGIDGEETVRALPSSSHFSCHSNSMLKDELDSGILNQIKGKHGRRDCLFLSLEAPLLCHDWQVCAPLPS